jgi:hypothetical protein
MIKANGLTNTHRGKQSASLAAVNLERHARKCAICHHADREDIDAEFVDWHAPDNIVEAYDLPSRSALYRHANATGLYQRRRRNLRRALEHMIEQSESILPSGQHVIQAVRALACITPTGRWTEPPKRLILSRELPGQPEPVLIGTARRLEIAATPTKE